MDPTDINVAIDSQPGSRYDTVRVARTSTPRSPASSPSPRRPAGRRGRRRDPADYAYGPAVLADPRLHRARSAEELAGPEGRRLPPDDLIGRAGVEATYEERSPRRVRAPDRRARRRRPPDPGAPDHRAPSRAALAPPDDRRREQQEPRRRCARAEEAAGLSGRRHRHEPAERRDPGDGQPAHYDNNVFSARDQRRPTTRRSSTTREAAGQPRDQRSVPARLDVQARRRDRRLADGKITAPTRIRTVGYLTLGGFSSGTGTARLRGCATSTAASATRATRSSTRPPRCSGSTGSATGPSSTASAQPTGIDLPAEVGGIVPTNKWKLDDTTACRSTRARSTSPASARATTRSRRSSS